MQTNECITDEVLAAWAQGTAAPGEVATLHAHVSSCAECRTVLAELARTSGQRPSPRTLGRYVLEEKVGAGGMGTVFSAWDPVVQRKVAVKVLHEASLEREAGPGVHRAQRFLLERQVLAGLEHPHITRLLDAGETEEGRPWFAMDFVDGQPLDVSCDERCLTPRQRLELMLPIFGAVAYAHQHLVVHRDLKPGNILVDGQGAPHLMDFGIARLLESDAGLTQTGMAPMTPAYASPEQVRREPAAVTSDVYSLGVVLYESMTGVSPYVTPRPDVESLLHAIQHQEVLPPSLAVARASEDAVARRAPSREKLRRALSEDIDAIVLMALRKEPRDRYPSVEALAADIRAALEGLPTLARRGGTAYRAARFLRRRKALVAGVVTAFLALSVGLVATLWQARRAEHERDLARARFDQVRTLARAVLFDYHDGIADLPGSTPLRQRLVKDASAYLEALSAEAKDDVGLRKELANGYLKLGDVQGDPFAASLGDTGAARANYLQSRALAQSVLAELPRDWDARRVVASSHEKLGAIFEVAGDLSEALQAYDTAHALDAQLSAERPDDLDQRFTVSRDDLAAGQVLLQKGDLEGAAVHLERCLAERRVVVATRADVKTRRGVAVVLISLGELRQEQAKLEQAIAHTEEAERLFEGLCAENPDAVDLQRGLTRAWGALAGLYRLAAQPARAVEVARKAVAKNRLALKADPTNAVAQRDLVVSLGNLGSSLSAAKDLEAVREVETESLALQRALREADPENVQSLRDLVYLLSMSSGGALDRGEHELAEARLRELIELAASAAALGGDGAAVEEEAVMAHHGLAQVREAQGKLSDADALSGSAQEGPADQREGHGAQVEQRGGGEGADPGAHARHEGRRHSEGHGRSHGQRDASCDTVVRNAPISSHAVCSLYSICEYICNYESEEPGTAGAVCRPEGESRDCGHAARRGGRRRYGGVQGPHQPDTDSASCMR